MKTNFMAIPKHWNQPKYLLGQRTTQGMIVGIQYCLFENLLTPEREGLWRYAVLVSIEDEQIQYVDEASIQLPSPQELRLEVEAELEFYQRKIQNLQQQLEAT